MLGNIIGNFKNNPFEQDLEVLSYDLQNLIKIVEGNQAEELIPLLTEAFDYFTKYPELYDGTSGDEESGASKKYDIPSIIHDYLSVIGLDYKYNLLKLSDKLFVAHMKALNFYSLQIFKRKAGLFLIAPFRYIRRVYMANFNKRFKYAVDTVDFLKWQVKITAQLNILGS